MTTKTKTQQRRPSAPTPWAAEWTRPAVDGASGGMSDLIPIATIAAGSCRPAETDGGATVATPASSGPPVADGPSVSLSTSPSPLAIRLPVPNVSADKTHCEQCGAAFVARRPWGRFCSSYCRRLAWLGRNPEKAAELAERDRARLKAHIIGNDGEWVEREAYHD